MREVILHKVSLPTRVGQTAALMGQIDDVTEARRTARALAREQVGLKLVVQAVQGGVWDWDLRTDSIATSARFRQILGFETLVSLSTKVKPGHPAILKIANC